MIAIQEDICRKIEARLATNRAWRDTPVGQLAKSLIDRSEHIPIQTAADFIGVDQMMIRRWLYGAYNPSARQVEAIRRIKLLTYVLDYAYGNGFLPAPKGAVILDILNDIVISLRLE